MTTRKHGQWSPFSDYLDRLSRERESRGEPIVDTVEQIREDREAVRAALNEIEAERGK
jgi:hypothetical protein